MNGLQTEPDRRTTKQSAYALEHDMFYKHGCSDLPEYRSWQGMVARCHQPTNENYPEYGGRGIVVCERWREDISAFIADVGPRPSPRHSIDRINNDRGYEPGNVRWATAKEQANNRREARRTVNPHETGRSKTSGYKGVSWHHRAGRWRASMNFKKKHIHLGIFDTPEAAHAAYVAAVKQRYGT